MSKQTLSSQVEERIITDYFQEDPSQSILLPSEKDLCLQYNASRITIRESLKNLETRGYVNIIHGKGAVCVNNSVSVTISALQTLIDRNNILPSQIFDLRYALERQAATLAAVHADQNDKDRLQHSLSQMKKHFKDYDAYLKDDLQFHIEVAHASKNLLLASIIESLQPKIHSIIYDNTNHDMLLDISLNFHVLILQAIMNKDSAEAQKQMARHLHTTDALMSHNMMRTHKNI